MATFDIRPDASGLLRAESLNITISFTRTGPSTGRISWNIPTPAAGCAAGSQAYCGMLVTIDNTPIDGTKLPVHGTVYSSDPTASQSLFAGDKLGTAFVIGGFYHDTTTTFFDISGLMPDTPYYVSGFPVDCEFRYYQEGVHAYSLDYTNRGSSDTSGTQIILLNNNQVDKGVNPNDFTGLMPGITYSFSIQLGIVPAPVVPNTPNYCVPQASTYTVNVDGTNSRTYQDLINEINKNLSMLGGSIQSPLAPNTGAFYWDSTSLYQWNGSTNVPIDAIIQNTDPAIVLSGTYWLNTDTDVLSLYNGSIWTLPTVIKSGYNPIAPIADTSYWFDGTNGYVWNGTTWCLKDTIIQITDPSLTAPTTAGSYWLNTDTNVFYKWDNVLGMWVVVEQIISPVDPSTPTGTYWMNTSTNILYYWGAPASGWNQQLAVFLSERTPSFPAPGAFWYNPTSQELKQYDALLEVWNLVTNVILYDTDPTIRASCDIWLNTVSDLVFSWDIVSSSWVQVTTFYSQNTDPSALPTISDGTIWYNPGTDQLYTWMNNCFTLVDFVNLPTDPTSLANGVVWLNTTTNVYSVFSTPSTWTVITPIQSTNDPLTLPVGSYWFNPSVPSLQMWNGVAWISLMFMTSNPKPATGTMWFDLTTNTLKQWNGVSWILATPLCTVQLDCTGNMLFTDTSTGSSSYIQVTDITLFQSLDTVFGYNPSNPGTDGASNTPSYTEMGIGTDGSSDHRYTLMNEIRYELGYPIVDVELTPEQLDYAITKALSELRARSGIGYKRGFFFLRVNPETQRYTLTNKIQGMNKIVDIMGIYRLTSSFLSSAHGAGVYGQIVLQHLYNMGTFDLLSYHIMAEYTKTMEQLFAARLTFTWNEQQRELWIHHRFPITEPLVSIEATVERTEQDIMSDRYARSWIRKYAAALARLMLAEVRGKYSTLPGASGSITLNAAELRAAAKEAIDECLLDIDNYVVDKPEEYGMATTFIFG